MIRRTKLISYGLPLIALLAGASAAYSIMRNAPRHEAVTPAVSPPLQPSQLAPTRAEGFIGAVGLVEPRDQEIDIGAHVSGIVAKVLVEPGQRVSAGDPLFVLDERSATAQLAQRRADLVAAERRLDQTLARVPSLTAQRDAARAAAAAAQAELDDLRDQRRSADEVFSRSTAAITEREVTRRRNAERSAEGRLNEARARTSEAEAELKLIADPERAPTLEVDRANVELARQAVAREDVNLALLTVRAPIDATILQVNVRPGEFAPAGVVTTPLIILGSLDPLHVRVDIDENDIGLFSPTAKAYASLRGQAERRAELSLVRVDPIVVPKRSLTGASTERVDTRVLRVVYALSPGSLEAYSGQLVDVFIAATPRPATNTAQR